MSHPPKRPRRTKRRRRSLLLLAGGLVVVLGGFAQLQGDRFPARSQQLVGAPGELRIQEGVTAREVRAVGDGVRRAHRFTAAVLGRRVRGPVEVRIAHGDGCPDSRSGDGSMGEGGSGYVCVDAENPHWRWLVRNHILAATSISAHEYVHVWQAELGCLPSGDQRTYRWIVEGMATEIAWRALVRSGRATDTDVRRAIRRDGAFDPDLEPLRAYERAGGRIPQYALWHFAIRTLLRESVARGVVRKGRAELALRRFCERVGSGTGWRTAFERSFGLPVAGFYARFETATRSG